ncbi:hypothetical protein OSO01_21560 [Oceanobacillus sojae]|uniref:Uncharacterized protein n=1 Tax=Oceanobacillus sojae TaxID=582851 RepID=A0A511ZJ06_9BACI|nr:hypothetical protein OSO01_21560 [Oceanobacillus sojae]
MLKNSRSNGFHGTSNLSPPEIHYAFRGPRAHLLDKEDLVIGKPTGADIAKAALMPLGEKRSALFSPKGAYTMYVSSVPETGRRELN